MTGRDPHEPHRVATPLELLFDLTFATAFSLAAGQFAQLMAHGQFAPALTGFAMAGFAICWAWVNFSWFASAYDTDDWIYRAATLVQMIGVLILAIGTPRLFASLVSGGRVDFGCMVAGYVVMRIALVSQWLRAAAEDKPRRKACLTYAILVTGVQIGWVLPVLFPPSPMARIGVVTILWIAEFMTPLVSERMSGGTPWHAQHMVERYGLFALIALGEGIAGTVTALTAVIDHQGWTMAVALVSIAGAGLTFGLWWIYYIIPSGPIIEAHRDRAFVWGVGQFVLITSIVATGAGLHVAAMALAHDTPMPNGLVLLIVAVPVGVFLAGGYLLYYYLVRSFDRLHILLLGGTAAVFALSIVASRQGLDLAACLVILTGAPLVTIVGNEISGYLHQKAALARLAHEQKTRP
jgi:low temperature requirement protein LtrA